MEDVYKKALKELRVNKYKSHIDDENIAIYGVDWFYGVCKVPVEVRSQEVSEKTLVLDSFSQKVKEEMASLDTDIITKNGAVIEKKEKSKVNTDLFGKYLDHEEIMASSSSLVNELSANLRYLGKSNIRVLFVSDFLHVKEDYEDNEFNTLFEGAISNLFYNMVKAMKLEKDSFLLSAMKVKGKLEDESYKEILLAEIGLYKPELIITLGVSATHGLLDTKDRIKDIHGQFYNITVNEHSVEVLPLFSPHLLGSAPNMKKIAWSDMQKAMEKLSL